MSKRGEIRAELRKARQELEQLKDPLIQKARAMGYATEYIDELEAENKRLKKEMADQAISDLGGSIEIIAKLKKENEKQAEILRILKPRMNFGLDTEEGEKTIWFFTIYQGEHGFEALKAWMNEKEE